MPESFLKLLSAGYLSCATVGANAVYLNITNITVEEGPNSTYTTSNNTFSNGRTINKVIDAPTADTEEVHSQTTHLWFSGGGLELLFDFQQQYDLSELHFWNYNNQAGDFDVDQIDFTFFDGTNTQVGMLTVFPDVGDIGRISAQDIVLAAPLNVEFVTAFLTGTNEEVDFQNLGFTASLSTDRCETDPNDPICSVGDPPTSGVPTPATVWLIGLGLLGTGYRLKQLRT